MSQQEETNSGAAEPVFEVAILPEHLIPHKTLREAQRSVVHCNELSGYQVKAEKKTKKGPHRMLCTNSSCHYAITITQQRRTDPWFIEQKQTAHNHGAARCNTFIEVKDDVRERDTLKSNKAEEKSDELQDHPKPSSFFDRSNSPAQLDVAVAATDLPHSVPVRPSAPEQHSTSAFSSSAAKRSKDSKVSREESKRTKREASESKSPETGAFRNAADSEAPVTATSSRAPPMLVPADSGVARVSDRILEDLAVISSDNLLKGLSQFQNSDQRLCEGLVRRAHLILCICSQIQRHTAAYCTDRRDSHVTVEVFSLLKRLSREPLPVLSLEVPAHSPASRSMLKMHARTILDQMEDKHQILPPTASEKTLKSLVSTSTLLYEDIPPALENLPTERATEMRARVAYLSKLLNVEIKK